jgi:putative spermidine/putrescine transport system substrate-binding protein
MTEIRVIGTSVTLLESLRKMAAEDLGFEISYEVLSGTEVQQRAMTAPSSFDIYDQWFNSVELLWTAGAIQPIDTQKVSLWEEVGQLTKTGRINADAKRGLGACPCDLQFVQVDGDLGSTPTDLISMLPTAHNVDAFAFDEKVRAHYGQDAPHSWAWLVDEAWSGKCGLHADPAIGVADVILAAQAAGWMNFEDQGNLSIEEIDTLINMLIERKKSGQFKHFWLQAEDSVNLFRRKNTNIAGIWSPAISNLSALGTKVTCASPIEGYRGWHGGLCLSSQVSDATLEKCYAYLNWWLSGKAGATIARQGYYMSVASTTRTHLSEAEWNYWYLGQPAQEDLPDPEGNIVIKSGQTRDGGGYQERLSNIAVWSTLMDEHNYLVRRWNEFLAA